MLLFDESKRFYKGNLHTHTTNTDGRCSPEEVVAIYAEHDYDFLALTDHWKRTVEEAYFAGKMLVLPGIELDYTLPGQVIHIVGINPDESILTTTARNNPPQHGINAIRRAGGRAILAHPAWSLNTPETIAALHGLTAAEIYNSVSGVPWNGDRADASSILDLAAVHGILLNTVAADDSHFYTGEQCASWIMLQTDELTPEGIVDALDKGAYYATRGPRFEQIEVTESEIRVRCSAVRNVVFHSELPYSRFRCACGEDGALITEAVYPLDRENRNEYFVRAILIDENGKYAWANPIRVR